MEGEIHDVEYDFSSIDFTTKGLLPLYEPLTGEYHTQYGICATVNLVGEIEPEVVKEIDVTVTV